MKSFAPIFEARLSMTFDIYATLVIAVLTALMAFIGIEMVNNPPSKKWHKWAWRITFIVISLPLIVIEVKVAIHTDDERQQTEEKGNKERLENRGDIRFMEGKLDAIASFESEYLANPQKQNSSSELANALAILKIAQSKIPPDKPSNPPAIVTAPPPSLPFPPTPTAVSTLALKNIAIQMATEIDDWVNLNKNNAPAEYGPQAAKPSDIATYSSRLNSEWSSKFSMAETVMIQLQKATGDNEIRRACLLPTPNIQQILDLRGMCGRAMRQEAEMLK
jgi:hypothetical protein